VGGEGKEEVRGEFSQFNGQCGVLIILVDGIEAEAVWMPDQ